MELLLAFVALLFIKDVTSASSQQPVDYCQFQSFNATCPDDSVIVMTSAKYGRMRDESTCIKSKGATIGCFVNVLDLADSRCSGRRECEISVPDQEMASMIPCHNQDLVNYLEAAYECVKVEGGQTRLCHAHEPLLARGSSGYISSVVTVNTGLGAGACPWVIEVPVGQRINVTLIDFSTRQNRLTNDKSQCSIYATIKEEGHILGRDVQICDSNERVKRAHTSDGNRIELRVNQQAMNNPKNYFLFKYEAIGCANIEAPSADSWVIRVGDKVTFGCNKTDDRWHKECVDSQWVGVDHNCSSTGGRPRKGPDDTHFPFGLVISIVLGIVLGVVIGFSMLMLVLACRKWRVRKSQRNELYKQSAYDHSHDYVGGTMPAAGKWPATPSSAHKTTAYAHIWELKNQPPASQGGGSVDAHGVFSYDVTSGAPVASGDGQDAPPLGGVTRQHSVKAPRDRPHVYESPQFGRKEYVERTDGVMLPYYHEFEPHLYDGQGREVGCPGGSECGHIFPGSSKKSAGDS